MPEGPADHPIITIQKYAKPEIERRWLVELGNLPPLTGLRVRKLEDKYLSCGRLRLRKVSEETCAPVFKLGKKTAGEDREPEQVVSIYLTEKEYHALQTLPGRVAIKHRYSVGGGSLDLYQNPSDLPAIFEVEFATPQLSAEYVAPKFAGKEVTFDPAFSGFAFAQGPTKRRLEIVPCNPDWPGQFATVAAGIRHALGEHALAVEHIGSTAVPGLGAKDVIDVQVSVARLDPLLLSLLDHHGFRARGDSCDLFDGIPAGSPELAKYYAREPAGQRRVHIHIREAGRFNHRFALLFRDFLRADEYARGQYLECKIQASKVYPHDIDGYLSLKGPVFHLLYRLADRWAKKTGWPGKLDSRTSPA